MGTLYDKASGKPVDVPDAQLTHALLSGQYLTDKPQVTVSTGGKVYSVPTENLGKFAAAQPDLKVMSDAEVAAHEQQKQQEALQAQYGGLGSQAKVAAVGALGGATLGLSDVALGALMSPEAKEELAKQRAANPYTDIGSGVVGALLPTVLTGGAAAPEEGAALAAREGASLAARAGEETSTLARVLGGARDVFTAPTRALEGASSLAERGAAHLVGSEAESFSGQLAQRAIAKAAGGAVTGGLATGGMDIGEDAISPDHNLTGEQLLTHMGLGALLGGGLGAIGAAGSATLERALAPAAEDGTGNAIREAIGKKAAELQFSATGAKTPEIKRLAASGLTPEQVGRWQLDNLAKYTEDGSAPMTRQGIMDASQNAMDQAAPKIGDAIGQLDRLGAKVDAPAVIDRLRNDLIKPLEKKLGMQAVANRISGIVDQAESRLNENGSFSELFNLRKELDDLAYRDRKVLDQSNAMQQLREARRTIEDEIGKQGEAAAGPEWKQAYDAAKNEYRMAASVNEAAMAADKRIAGNRGVSLTDTIMASHGLGALAVGHPLGLVAGFAGGVANHLLRTYGDAVGSRLLDRLVSTGALESTLMPIAATRAAAQAQKSYGLAMTRGLAALTRGEMASNAPGRPKTIDGDFAQKSKLVQTVINNPQGHVQQIQSQANALGPTFPTVGSAYQRAAMASSVYLAQQLPKPRPLDPSMPKAGTVEPTKAEKSKFNRVFDAVQDPPSLLHKAAKGELTRSEVDAVAATHPTILADMQKRTTEELKTLKQPLSPVTMASVKMLLGEPVLDHPVQPKAPAAQEAPPPGAPPKPKSATARPLKLNAQNVGLVGTRPSLS